jgi:hypothetical protein
VKYQPPTEDLGSGSILLSETDQGVLADFAVSASKPVYGDKFTKESSDGGKQTQQIATQSTTTRPIAETASKEAESETVDLDSDDVPIKPKVKKTDFDGLFHQAKAFISNFSKLDVESFRDRADRQVGSEEDDVLQIEEVLLPELNRKVGRFGSFLGAHKHCTNELIDYWQENNLYDSLGMSYNTFVSFIESSNAEYVSLIKKLETKISLTPSAQEVKLNEAKDLLTRARNASHSLRMSVAKLKAGIKQKGGLSQAKGNLNSFEAKALSVQNKLTELEVLLLEINDSFIKESADNDIASFKQSIEDATILLDVLSLQVFGMARTKLRSGGSSPGEDSGRTISSTAAGQSKKVKKNSSTKTFQ